MAAVMATANEVVVELPEDIVTDILMQLAVKSLVRFRCVCKSWRSLIDNPIFIRKHLNFTTNTYNNMDNNEYESAVLFIKRTDSEINSARFKYLEIYKEEEEKKRGNYQKITSSVNEFDCPPELSSASRIIWACCNGILCIINSSRSIFLWNPSIKVYKKLPPSCNDFRLDDVFGIGYDSIVDDYKVIRAPSVAGKTTNSQPPVEVLALKSNSWKTLVLEEFPYNIWVHSPTFTDGRIHWIGDCDGARVATIIYFDVVGEKFGVVPLPPGGSGSTRGSGDLQLLRGKLCVSQCKEGSRFDGSPFDLWVMMEYGVRESWIKLMSVPQIPPFFFYGCGVWATIFCWTRTGVVFSIQDKGEFIMYNTKDESFEKISIGGVGIISEKIPYLESLVSPLAY